MNLRQALDCPETHGKVVGLIDDLQGHLDMFEKAHEEGQASDAEFRKACETSDNALRSMLHDYHEILDDLQRIEEEAEAHSAKIDFLNDMQGGD